MDIEIHQGNCCQSFKNGQNVVGLHPWAMKFVFHANAHLGVIDKKTFVC